MYPCFPKVWFLWHFLGERVETDLEWDIWDVESGRGLGGLGGGF